MGLGPGVKRFIGGFAAGTLNSIQQREQYERELQKEKMLQQLRTEQAKELADYQELINKKKPNKDMSTTDYVKGKRVLRNEYGEVLGEQDVPESEKQQFQLENTKSTLELDNIRSQISSRAADDARQSRSTAAYIRSLDRQGVMGADGRSTLNGDGKLTSMDIANEIKFRQKDIVDDLVKSGVPAETIQQMIIRSMKQAAARGLPPSKAEEIFVTAAPAIRKAYAESAANTLRQRKGLDDLD